MFDSKNPPLCAANSTPFEEQYKIFKVLKLQET